MSKEQEPADNAAIAAERERYDDLQRSVMDLSHPNCKVLLKERNEALEQLAVLTRENDWRDEREAEYAGKMVAEIQARDKQLAAANDAMSGMTEHHANFGVRQERDKAMKQLAAERERTARYSMQADDLNGENQQLREQLATAIEALQMLHDYQNGCPLPSYWEGWNEAMRQAESALSKIKEGK